MTDSRTTILNVLIVDDHEIFIEALGSLLQDAGDMRVIATGTNGQEALKAVQDHPEADLLILDISMPIMNGIETLLELRSRKNSIPVLMLTQEFGGTTISTAMKAGASGYVLKTASREEFVSAVRTVASGGEYISTSVKTALASHLQQKKTIDDKPPLTRAETDVLRLVVDGKTTKEIAELLFVSPYTAETHRRNILQKLDLRNVAALVKYTIENGLLDE